MSAGQDDKLSKYRGMRSAERTPEPVPEATDQPHGNNDTFVIQEHHATALHWDFRLERDGVLVSWAVPKGLPMDPKTNHLAVHTEDHPLDYASFEGEIPKGEYGGGKVILWDHGTYTTEKWRDNEVIVVLAGSRVSGRYVLFQTKGDQWMVHRMDPPPRPDWQPMPRLIQPMLATLTAAPRDDGKWAYEMKWDGIRAVVYIDGGRARVMTRNDRDVTDGYPELRQMAEETGGRQLILDGEIVSLDANGRPDFGRLQRRMHVTDPAQVRRLAAAYPISYVIFDLLYLDGRSLVDRSYDERRAALADLGLQGKSWAVPPAFEGGGQAALDSSRQFNLEGVVAKRRESKYQPGKRSRDWIKIKHLRTQEVVIGGWSSGQGDREGKIGALLLGIPDQHGQLRYVGKVGTGFNQAALADLAELFGPLRRDTSPFADELDSAERRGATWLEPVTVGEVSFADWTSGNSKLRHAVWRGLRPDKSADGIVRES